MATRSGLVLHLISVHGLIRGHDLELGRDADTGGQTKYVVELARALAAHDEIARVELLTRRVVDPTVHADYARRMEPIADGASIVRIDAGPEEYIRKEELWDHLDSFADNCLLHVRESGNVSHLVHGHYADAGYVGVRLAHQLEVPLVFTGHSLGQVKRRRMLAAGLESSEIEAQFAMSRRIHAEEETLASADLVIVSTTNEIREQYSRYDYYQPDAMCVVPPGTDLERFHPPEDAVSRTRIEREIARFLRRPNKPAILAICRPDVRKNVHTLLEAYGESPDLQRVANLVVVVGNRENIRELDTGPRRMLRELLLTIDHYDLYGKVAYPKHHNPDEVPEIYRIAARTGGVFVNPALTEPFGLTLLEAAASGLPIVATEDGGPQDIVRNCENGILVDPLDKQAIASALLRVLTGRQYWRQLATNGLRGVETHYSWAAHVDRYLKSIYPLIGTSKAFGPVPRTPRPMLYHDRALFTDLDQTLLGDPDALRELIALLESNRRHTTFAITTGRTRDSALRVLRRHGIPLPDILVTGVGTEIRYAPGLEIDKRWAKHIDHMWSPRRVRKVLDPLPGLELQEAEEQSRSKISYYMDVANAPTLEEIQSALLQEELTVNIVLSFGQFLDVVPVRASKGLALRYLANQWGIPLERILVAGGSGADEDMLRGNTLAVVAANRHDEELSQLDEADDVYFAQGRFAQGILEGIEHFDFFGELIGAR